jgi:hypothetical protein
MSAVQSTKPTPAAGRALRAISGGKLAKLAGGQNANPKVAIVVTLIIGVAAIQTLQLLLNIFVAQGAYQLSDLKKEKRELGITAQIIGEQVDSLSSNQNLANAAQKMGMISNANPVFLRLDDQRVFGKPKAALNAENRTSRNLIPNSQLVVTSNITPESLAAAEKQQAEAAAEAATTSTVTTPTSVTGGGLQFGAAAPSKPATSSAIGGAAAPTAATGATTTSSGSGFKLQVPAVGGNR